MNFTKPFLKTYSNPSPFSFSNSISYESWHIQLEWEVAEVARVQAKKSSIKNYEIFDFWGTQTLYISKRKLIIIVIQIWNKIRGFCYEKVEKKMILWLSIPKNYKPLSSLLILWEMERRSPFKLSWPTQSGKIQIRNRIVF